MKRFTGKVAIVTGSTNGIGFSIARRLGQDGAQVLVSSRKQANVDEAVKKLQSESINVDGVVCHVGKEKDRESLVNTALTKYGRVDILVNNAGINPHYGSLLDVSENVWDKIFDVNVKAGFLLSKLVIPHMEKQGGGNIVFNSSITGFVPFQFLGDFSLEGTSLENTVSSRLIDYLRMPSPILSHHVTGNGCIFGVWGMGIAAYSVSKTAVIGLVHALAMTCGPMKIRVNGIAPGIVKTEFSKALWEDEETGKFHAENIPLGRLAVGDDCAGAVSFLCSDDANYITGEVIMITGGINARL